MGLLEERATYKPFQYPWCYTAWEKQQKLHWLPEEVPLGDDRYDWEHRLTPAERNLTTQIFRFFTQADVEVGGEYMDEYLTTFKPMEVKMMLTAFANMETIHMAGYSHLLDTIGMPEAEYEAFLKYAEMKEKHDFLQQFNMKTPYNTALTMAVFGAFTEGMALFASFAILMNFPRFGKMKGMGQIVTWSVRDETLHCVSIIRLFHEFLREHPEIDRADLNQTIVRAAHEMVKAEDAFIDLCFEQGGIEGLTPEEVKRYIRYISNRRFEQLGIDSFAYAGVEENPLPWMDEILNGVEHANFFEARATEYSRAATKGTWDEVFTDAFDKADADAGVVDYA